MKNFKRLVAGTIAATMALALSVSAFAEVEVTSPVNAYYASGAAGYTGTITADDGTQMTVVIFNAEKQLADLTGEDLLYINQDEEGELSLTSMGTKVDLLEANEDGSAKYAGNYVIRVGYYANNTWTAAEGTFTIGTKANAPTYTLGELNGSAPVDISDAIALLEYCAKLRTFDETELLAAELNGSAPVDISDAIVLLEYCAKLITEFPVETK